MTDGQDARGSSNLSAGYYHCTIMQRRILEKYIFYQSLGNLSFDAFTGSDEISQRKVVLHHYQSTSLLFAHVKTGHKNGHNCIPVVAIILVEVSSFLGLEEAQQFAYPFMGSQSVEEMTYLFLEKYDDGYTAHAYQLVKNTTQQFHLQYLADKNPKTNEDKYSIEDVHRA